MVAGAVTFRRPEANRESSKVLVRPRLCPVKPSRRFSPYALALANHPDQYHAWVHMELLAATEGLSGRAYRDALINTLLDIGAALKENEGLIMHGWWKREKWWK